MSLTDLLARKFGFVLFKSYTIFENLIYTVQWISIIYIFMFHFGFNVTESQKPKTIYYSLMVSLNCIYSRIATAFIATVCRVKTFVTTFSLVMEI